MARTSKSSGIGIPVRWGVPALIAWAFAAFWLLIYTTAQGNGIGTGGLGPGSQSELLLLLVGIPIVFLGLSKKFDVLAIGVGVAAGFGLFIDNAIFQSPLISQGVLNGLSTFSTSSQFAYKTSPQSLVVTLMSFSTSEESAMSTFRTIFDFALGVDPGKPGYLLKGVVASLLTTGPMFDMIHLFVTVPAYSSLLNAPPLFGFFNVALLLTPFSLSAIVARVILDTANRASRDHISGVVGHAGWDGIVTAHAVGLF